MIHAYDKVYLEKARTALGRMLDFAVYDLKYAVGDFWGLFLTSGIAKRFGEGDFQLLVGMSGVELAYKVLECSGIENERIKPMYASNRSEEYWTGWALAYYQWETDMSFAEMNLYVPIKEVLGMYHPFHEMDIRQFVDAMNVLYKERKKETNLKIRRQKAGLSQKELSELAGIPLRTIQQYEQRQKNINKAQVQYLIAFAMVFSITHCCVNFIKASCYSI